MDENSTMSPEDVEKVVAGADSTALFCINCHNCGYVLYDFVPHNRMPELMRQARLRSCPHCSTSENKVHNWWIISR